MDIYSVESIRSSFIVSTVQFNKHATSLKALEGHHLSEKDSKRDVPN